MTATERVARLPAPADGTSHRSYQPTLMAALDEFQAAVIRAVTLDPVTVELIRLRCARVHDCRACQRLRFEPARAAGADEQLLGQVDRYETSALSERHKVALRLADAHLFGHVPPGLSAEVEAVFEQDEARQIVLLVAKFSFQKSLVALGLDEPRAATSFTWDVATGEHVLG